mgnify:CR=1 FL=1
MTYLNVSKDKSDKNSIYVGDLVGYLLGIEEAKEHILDYCKREDLITKEMEAKIQERLEIIEKYFKE